MQAYNNKSSNRRQSRCSYCGQAEHRVIDCPYAEKDWASLKKGIIPLNSPTPRNWYKLPKYWGDWHKSAKTAVSKIEAARERANQKRKPSTTPRTCGFCGSADHTRRNCAYMQDFIAKCEKANANWRRGGQHGVWRVNPPAVAHWFTTGAAGLHTPHNTPPPGHPWQ